MFTINKSSNNQEAAWSLLDYIGSKQFADEQSGSTNQLLARTGSLSEYDGRNLDSFYKLEPTTDSLYIKSSSDKEKAVFAAYYAAAAEQLQQIKDNQITIDQALASIETIVKGKLKEFKQ